MRVHACAAALLLSSVSMAGRAETHLFVEPAWNGGFAAGAPTELAVRIDDAAAPHIYRLVYFDTGDVTVSHELGPMLPDVIYHLPLIRTRSGEIEFRLVEDGGRELVSNSRLDRFEPELPTAVVVGSLPDPTARRRIQFRTVAPRTLPVRSASYRAIDLVIIDAAAWDEITRQQERAFLGYVQDCGDTILRDFRPGAAATIRSAAGCGGSRLTLARSDAEVADAIARTTETRTAWPAKAEIASLLPSGPDRQIFLVSTAVTLYLGAMLVLVLRPRTGVAHFAVPLLASAVAILTWAGTTHAVDHAVSWSEISLRDGVARSIYVTRIGGDLRGETRIVSGDLLEPLNRRTTLKVFPREEGDFAYAVQSYLLSPIDLIAYRRAPLSSVLAVSMRGRNPVVRNLGAEPSSEALVTYEGKKFPVPALPPGDEWQPQADADVGWGTDPAERLFRRESLSAPAALLVHNTRTRGAAAHETDDYVVVRP